LSRAPARRARHRLRRVSAHALRCALILPYTLRCEIMLLRKDFSREVMSSVIHSLYWVEMSFYTTRPAIHLASEPSYRFAAWWLYARAARCRLLRQAVDELGARNISEPEGFVEARGRRSKPPVVVPELALPPARSWRTIGLQKPTSRGLGGLVVGGYPRTD
jgi:hypothetical protein